MGATFNFPSSIHKKFVLLHSDFYQKKHKKSFIMEKQLEEKNTEMGNVITRTEEFIQKNQRKPPLPSSMPRTTSMPATTSRPSKATARTPVSSPSSTTTVPPRVANWPNSMPASQAFVLASSTMPPNFSAPTPARTSTPSPSPSWPRPTLWPRKVIWTAPPSSM